MKHLSALLCALILLLSVPIIVYADEEVYTEGTLYYTIGDQTVTIVGSFGKAKEVTVPASIAGYPVNTIASGAFASNRYIEKLNLPDTITAIGENAVPKGVRVVYNANTDHPQDEPTDIINRGATVPQQTTAAQPAKPTEPKKTASEIQRSAASSQAGGDRILEGDVEDTEENVSGSSSRASSSASSASSVASSPSAAASSPTAEKSTVAASSSSVGKTTAATDATAVSAGKATADQHAAEQDSSGGMVWVIIAIAAGVIAAGVIAFLVIRKKKTTR